MSVENMIENLERVLSHKSAATDTYCLECVSCQVLLEETIAELEGK